MYSDLASNILLHTFVLATAAEQASKDTLSLKHQQQTIEGGRKVLFENFSKLISFYFIVICMLGISYKINNI